MDDEVDSRPLCTCRPQRCSYAQHLILCSAICRIGEMLNAHVALEHAVSPRHPQSNNRVDVCDDQIP
jgi:hypothetical protein